MTYTLDWDEHAPRLAAAAADEAGWYAAVVAELVRDTDRVAIDVGCGGAGMTVALARRIERVIAADHNEKVLDAARTVVADAGTTAEFALVDLDQELALPEADLVWSSAAVHHAGDQQATLDKLARLVKPGGRLAIAEGGLRPRYLPWDLGVGEPGLEVRLDAAQDRWFARMRAELPGSVPMPYGWPEALRRAGLDDVTTRTFLLERPVPLSAADRERVVAQLGKRLEWLRDTDLLTADDRRTWDRLLDPDGPDWLGHRDDLHSIEARSVQLGTRKRKTREP
ncbi:class I SAM-dependent methyltransferase [Dactylosporangium sp. AC04546]|uniref:class I SAM-dependent methyltransferase n=1 Tax=Dactylosporangium sp. AC04546 TaxID=2862460 RepID=UPI001EE06C08|nr:class I SAM-dependent methyltransferase [Dactylosporangium sp. AC04546]WVK85609.1 class I SAM-dependent methyltransferase [Dactylosporangium sp. AC04546]